MENLIELQNKKQIAVDALEAIVNKGKAENRSLTQIEEDEVVKHKVTIALNEEKIKEIQEADKRNVETFKEKNINYNMNTPEKKFSFFRALNAVVNQQPFTDAETRLMKIGNNAFQMNGLTAKGQITIPLSENRMYADLFGASMAEKRAILAAASNASVQTNVMDLLGPLYAKNPLLLAGSQAVFATSNLSYPAQSAIAFDYVDGENTASTDKTPTNSVALSLTPMYIRGHVDISKTLLVQENSSNETIIRNSIVNGINKAIVSAFFGKHLASVAYKPKSLFGGLTGVPYAYIGATSADAIFKMIAAVDAQDALEGSLGFIFNPYTVYQLRQTPAFASATTPILNGNDVAGFPYYTTTTMPSDLQVTGGTGGTGYYGAAFADWSNLVQAFFGATPDSLGAVSIMVDPYTQAHLNTVRLHINIAHNMGILRNESFTKAAIL
jgi:hypothetical protein